MQNKPEIKKITSFRIIQCYLERTGSKIVALDENKQPKEVPAIIAETAEQIKYYDGALRRRQLRLILGGKMKPDDATELKALFVKD